MTFTYNVADLSTPLAQVRTLIPDTDSAAALLQDEQINVYLTLEGENVKRAAALALERIASNQALVLKVIETLDLRTDGASLARELRLNAKLLRDQAEQDDSAAAEDGAIDYAEWVVDDASYRSVISNQWLRGAV